MDFFDRVKAAAKTRGTTIEYLAGRAGLTRGAWNTYRRRNLLPRADEAIKVARELGISVEYLVDGIEAESLGSADAAFLARARRWTGVIDDLNDLTEDGQRAFVIALHANAEAARASRESTAAGE
jgi:transcriptional regulator with XRE-family HTH domain